MPKGKRGTGPGARKRIQRFLNYPTSSAAYRLVELTLEEASLIYEGIRLLPADLGSRQGAFLVNLMYRITEQAIYFKGEEAMRLQLTEQELGLIAQGLLEIQPNLPSRGAAICANLLFRMGEEDDSLRRFRRQNRPPHHK